MRYAPRKVMATVILTSAVAHAIAITPDSIRYPAGKVSELGSALIDRYERYQIRKDREALIEEARTALKEGRLNLGGFVLKGNDLDARGRGEKPDLGKAQSRYDGMLDALSRAVYEGKQPYESIPEILKGMDYYGIPGGTVLDALLQNGGSCEQYAPLIASLLYDANYREESFIRTYGANSDGVGHVTPIYRHGGREYDLMAGGYSDMRGTLFPASEIVEAYARAHGLALLLPAPPADPAEVSSDGAENTARREASKTLPDGKPIGLSFPPGKDAYEGAVPLFAKDAIKPFNPSTGAPGGFQTGLEGSAIDGASGESMESLDNAKDGTVPVETGNAAMAAPPAVEDFLNPQNLARLPGSTNPALIRVHPVDIPAPEALEGLSARIEIDRKWMLVQKGWNKVLAMGVLAGLYSEAYWNFKLIGKDTLADVAARQREKIIEDVAPLLGEWASFRKISYPWGSTSDLDPAWGAHWSLAYLGQKGDDAFFTLMEGQLSKYPFMNLAYFLAKEQSRPRALEFAGRLTIGQQAAIFPRLRNAEVEGPQDMLRAYKIYNHVTEFFSPNIAVTPQNAPAAKSETPAQIVTLKKGQGAFMLKTTVQFEGISGDSAVFAFLWGPEQKLIMDNIRQGESREVPYDFNGSYASDTIAGYLKVLNIEPGKSDGDVKVRLEMRMVGPKPAGEKDKEIARGVLNAHETLVFGDYRVRFEQFFFATGAAEITILRRNKGSGTYEIIHDVIIDSGNTIGTAIRWPTMDIDDHPGPQTKVVRVKLNGWDMAPDMYPTIDLSILADDTPSSGETQGDAFAGLIKTVGRECDEEGLGEEWKIALINECAISDELVRQVSDDERFVAGYREWAASTREKRKALGIAPGAGSGSKDEVEILRLWQRTY